jgi:hypothetical protein
MDIFTAVLSGFAISAPAGLNAWLPLLIVGLAGRFTNLIHLAPPFDILTNTWVLVILCVLLLIEIFADKIPMVDTVNDIIHTFIRPLAGGILFAAYSGAIDGIDPVLSFILGLLSAGGVHAVKATARPMVTATTGGIGNPLVSFAEDFVAAGATVLALIVPVLAAVLMAITIGAVLYIVMRLRARRRRKRQAQI